jgi:hypothetical protein
MKVLYIGLARSLWLFDLGLLNPKGVSLKAAIDGIKARYDFAQAPKHQLDVDERGGLSFKSGRFVNPQGAPVLVTLSIYNDGMVCDASSSTDDSTRFLEDVTQWIKSEYGLAVPENVRRAYVGQIDFETETQLISLNPALQHLKALLDGYFQRATSQERSFNFAGVGFWTEDFGQPSAPAAFKYERKIGAALSSNHYFSQAPLETNAHLELLTEMERLLSAAK